MLQININPYNEDVFRSEFIQSDLYLKLKNSKIEDL